MRQARIPLIAIGICVSLNMLDGFDVLAMALVAPGVGNEWRLSGSELGVLFSAGILGMVLGSVCVAPLADRFGRRSLVLFSVALVGIGMLSCGLARNFQVLAAFRLLAGLGIGGVLACAMVLISEFSSDRWRNTAAFIYTCGYSLGATLGGAAVAVLITHWGWRSAFLLGAAASGLMLPIAYWGLPESPNFISRRVTRDARQATRPIRPIQTFTLYWLTRSTLLLWLAYFFAMSGYYFVFSWTPKLIANSGMTIQQGVGSGVLLSVGGMVGTLLMGVVATKVEIRLLAFICLLASAALMGAFSLFITSPWLAAWIGVLLGGASTSALAGTG